MLTSLPQVHRGAYEAAKVLYDQFLPLVEEHLALSPFAKIVFTVRPASATSSHASPPHYHYHCYHYPYHLKIVFAVMTYRMPLL